jgi:hypothetical protein
MPALYSSPFEKGGLKGVFLKTLFFTSLFQREGAKTFAGRFDLLGYGLRPNPT